MKRLDEFKELKRNQAKTTMIIDLIESAKENPTIYLKLLQSSKEFFSIINEIQDKDIPPQFMKLYRVHSALNEQASQSIQQRFGVSEINLDNLEQIYDANINGKGTLVEMR